MAEPYLKSRPHGYIRRPYAAYIRGAPGGPNNFTKVNFDTVSALDELFGYRNPAWKSQIRSGSQAGTYMIATRVTVESTPTEATFTRPRSGGTDTLLRRCQYDFLSVGQMSAGSVPFSLKQLALGRFYSRVMDVVSPIKGGTILGELVKTVRTLKRPLQSMNEHLRKYDRRIQPILRRARKPDRGYTREKQVHDLNQAYLGFTYGWTPAALDVVSLLNYAKRTDVCTDTEIVRVSEKSEVSTQYSETGGINQDSVCGDLWAVGGHELTKYHCKVKGVVSTFADTGPLRGVATDFGVLPNQWAPTIWELLPWSFMVDYFSNVGDIVNALSTPRSRIRWAIATDRSHRKLTSIGRAHVGNSWTTASGTCQHTVHSYKVERTCYDGNSLPIPVLAFQMPSLKQTLNTLSIALSLVRGRQITGPLKFDY
jgi:hypothetical protein